MSNSILFKNRNCALNPPAFTNLRPGLRHHTAAPSISLESDPEVSRHWSPPHPPAQGQAFAQGPPAHALLTTPFTALSPSAGSELQEQPKSWRAWGPHALGPPWLCPPSTLKAFLGQGVPLRVYACMPGRHTGTQLSTDTSLRTCWGLPLLGAVPRPSSFTAGQARPHAAPAAPWALLPGSPTGSGGWHGEHLAHLPSPDTCTGQSAGRHCDICGMSNCQTGLHCAGSGTRSAPSSEIPWERHNSCSNVLLLLCPSTPRAPQGHPRPRPSSRPGLQLPHLLGPASSSYLTLSSKGSPLRQCPLGRGTSSHLPRWLSSSRSPLFGPH